MGSTVLGMWSGVTFYCANHPQEKLVLKQGAYSVYYGCNHEYDEENPCHNRLNLIDAEKAIQRIMDKITEASFAGNLINLKNYKWNMNGIEFTILYHNPDNEHISILVNNKKILSNR